LLILQRCEETQQYNSLASLLQSAIQPNFVEAREIADSKKRSCLRL